MVKHKILSKSTNCTITVLPLLLFTHDNTLVLFPYLMYMPKLDLADAGIATAQRTFFFNSMYIYQTSQLPHMIPQLRYL